MIKWGMVFILLAASVTAVLPTDVALWSDLVEGSGYTMADQSGNANHGFSDSNLWSNDKPANLANGFITNGQSIRYPNSASTNIGFRNDSYAVSVWIKPDQTGEHMGVVGKYSGTPTQGYPVSLILIRDGRIYSETSQGDGVSATNTSTALVLDGEWHHIVMVRDGVARMVSVYIDGNLDFTYADVTEKDLVQESPWYFGGNPQADPYFYSGLIAQPIVFRAALDQEDVIALYNAGRGMTYAQFFSSPEVPEFSFFAIPLLVAMCVAAMFFKRTQ